MDQERHRHEKIRFRRCEVAALDSFPSACGRTGQFARRPASRILHWVAVSVSLLACLVVVLGLGVYLAGLAGVGSEPLAQKAEAAIQSLTDVKVETHVGSARIVFDRHNLLALEVRDVHIAKADGGETLLDAGLMRFGFDLAALLTGDLRLGSAKIERAEIAPADLRPTGGQVWSPAIKDTNGLIDPSLANTAIYGAVRRAFEFLEASGTRRIVLSDISLLAPPGVPWRGLEISSLAIKRAYSRGIDFTGKLLLGGRRILLEGRASRAPDGNIVDSLMFDLTVPHAERAEKAADSSSGRTPEGPIRSLGSLRVSIAGGETPEVAGNRLSLQLEADDLRVGLEPSDNITFDGTIRAFIANNSRSVTVQNATLTTGRSIFRFHGAFGPLRDVGEEGRPSYAFQFFSNSSTAAPEQSPEPALTFAARAAGRYVPSLQQLIADVISVNTGSGDLVASAAMVLEEGKSPGLSLAAAVSRMPTSHVKQLWPWFAASGAREWVLRHLFGGVVVDGEIKMTVPPGRLGNGVPLNEKEVHGRFQVSNTRFDVAGRIPPVREGNGEVNFAGTDVRVTLSSGTVYMPSGRKVSASSGTFVLKDAQLIPRIGRLEIDVQGAAPAIVELSSYEPISATRYLDLAPGDVTGKVKGHISADIPLQETIPVESLSWRVTLDFEGLSVAKPFDGQRVTDADGSLVVEPHRAEFEAKARLNGVPARLALIEPLGGSDVVRERDVVLELDDKARERLAPGLSTILSGTTTVGFQTLPDGRQKVSADLEPATISLPWIGWRKGAGIPATATFVLDAKEDTVALEDFELSGQGFAARGRLTLSEGSLMSARFVYARLNEGDNFAVSIDRSGSAYTVSVSGASVDARSVIKRFAPSTTGQSPPASSDSDFPVSLSVDVEQMKGFHGEILKNVKLSYAGTGSDISTLSVDAVTAANHKVTLNNSARNGMRSVRMQSTDAGSLLRFLDIYEHMEGGRVSLMLTGKSGEPLTGQIDARDFWIVNEPRLGSLVAATPSSEYGPGQMQSSQVDVSRVMFERGFAAIRKGEGYLHLSDGALRGPLIGTTFQGTLYDAEGNIAMTGTFMPAYGVNRIFGEIPVIGQILGNGRDRGLIGVTFRLSGKASAPHLEINPISAIAPGIFRQIFEFH